MPPGDVVVPAGLARPLAKLAVLGARVMAERDGALPLVPGMAGLIADLAGSAGGTGLRSVEGITPTWITAGEAAELAGVSAGYVRRLARGGRVRARRAGPLWLVDPDSLPIRRHVA